MTQVLLVQMHVLLFSILLDRKSETLKSYFKRPFQRATVTGNHILWWYQVSDRRVLFREMLQGGAILERCLSLNSKIRKKRWKISLIRCQHNVFLSNFLVFHFQWWPHVAVTWFDGPFWKERSFAGLTRSVVVQERVTKINFLLTISIYYLEKRF